MLAEANPKIRVQMIFLANVLYLMGALKTPERRHNSPSIQTEN
jgi:hypothetical protein